MLIFLGISLGGSALIITAALWHDYRNKHKVKILKERRKRRREKKPISTITNGDIRRPFTAQNPSNPKRRGFGRRFDDEVEKPIHDYVQNDLREERVQTIECCEEEG